MTGLRLARNAGVSPSYISLIEHGEKTPSERVAVRIARALGDSEDLYRAWAATSRMDVRTRRAVMLLGGSDGADGALPIPSLDPASGTLAIDASLLGRESADGLAALRVEEAHCSHAPRGIGPGDVIVIDRSQRALSDGALVAVGIGDDLRIVRARRENGQLVIPGSGTGRTPDGPGPGGNGSDVVGTVVWSSRCW